MTAQAGRLSQTRLRRVGAGQDAGRGRDRRGQMSSPRWRSEIVAAVLIVAGAAAMAADRPDLAGAGQLTPFAYVTQRDVSIVSVINTSTNIVVATVPVNGPEDVAITPDGRFAYVTTEQSEGSVFAINTSTNAVAGTVRVGRCPKGIAVTPNGQLAYVANGCSENVSVIETSTNTVIATIPVGAEPYGTAITPDGQFVYVANQNSSTVSVIRTSTNSVVATVPIEESHIGGHPRDIAITPDGKFAYATSDLGVFVIETATNTVLTAVPVGFLPEGVAATPNGQFAYVANFGTPASVSVIDSSKNTVAATVTAGIGGGADGLAITPDGQFTYVADFTAGVVVIGTSTNTVVATVPLAVPTDVAITPPIMGPETPITTPITTSISPPLNPPPTLGTSNPKPKPKGLSAARAFSLPSAKQCVSRRHFLLHVRRYPGVTWIGAVIKINHKRIRTLGRSHITALVDLRGLPKGTFVLSITATASDQRKVTGTRTYHTCVPNSKRHYPQGKL